MAVTVEDGSGVTGADSLVTRAAYIAYAATKGITVADDTDADNQLVKAMLFIDSLEPKMKGERVERDQALSYPREGVYWNGWAVTNAEIPAALKTAQMEVALYYKAGNDPFNPVQLSIATSKRVEGAVSVAYATRQPTKATKNTIWELLLAPFMQNNGMIALERA